MSHHCKETLPRGYTHTHLNMLYGTACCTCCATRGIVRSSCWTAHISSRDQDLKCSIHKVLREAQATRSSTAGGARRQMNSTSEKPIVACRPIPIVCCFPAREVAEGRKRNSRHKIKALSQIECAPKNENVLQSLIPLANLQGDVNSTYLSCLPTLRVI